MRSVACICALLRGYPGSMLGQTFLDVIWGLSLELLGGPLVVLAGRRVACGGEPLGLRLIEVLYDSLVVLLDDIFGNALHAEDFDVEALSVRECIFDRR